MGRRGELGKCLGGLKGWGGLTCALVVVSGYTP